MDWKEKVLLMREQNKRWDEIAEAIKDEFPNLTHKQRYEKARNVWRKRFKEDSCDTEEIDRKESIEYKSDGSTTFQKIIELMDGEQITPEVIMKAHNLNSATWEVLSYKTNFWQAQKKGGKKLLLYQSKITVKPSKGIELTFDDIDRYFEQKDYSKDKLPIECINYDEQGEILVIKICDLHVGLLSWKQETGEDYDLKIAKKNYFSCINDIVKRCKSRKFKKIVFVTLGDIIHCDNDKQETTNGTFQQTDGRLAKIIECAEDMLIDTITILGEMAPVEYIYTAGNHDRLVGYMLARSVSNVFRKDKNVTCDISPNPIKVRRYGVHLSLYHHGDAPKKNLGELPMKFARNELSYAKYVEVCLGHYHDEETKSVNGARIRYFPTICASSYWEHQQAYESPLNAIVCDVINENTGIRDTWYSNL